MQKSTKARLRQFVNPTIENESNKVEDNTTLRKYSSYVILDNCSIKTCAGECTTNTKCVCLPGYVNLRKGSSSIDDLHCSYKQKSQMTAFLLETFLPFGVGHFYSKRLIFGLSKMSIFFLPLITIISAVCGMLFTEKCLKTGNSSIAFIAILTVFLMMSFAWWIADIISFGLNYYLDGNDIPLMAW